MNIELIINREVIPLYTKYKKNNEKSQIVNRLKQKDYEYYLCDYCGKEIRKEKDWQNKKGGIVELSNLITKKGNMRLALHNRCLSKAINSFDEGRND